MSLRTATHADTSVDEARLLPRYRLHQQAHTFTTQYADATTNGRNVTAPTRNHKPNPADLRGIPCIAPGVAGTTPGTDPLKATLRKEHNR